MASYIGRRKFTRLLAARPRGRSRRVRSRRRKPALRAAVACMNPITGVFQAKNDECAFQRSTFVS